MEGVPGAEVAVVDRPARAKLGVALSEEGEAGDHLAFGNRGVAEGFREPDLHGVVVIDDIAVVGGEADEDTLGTTAGFDVAGEFGDVGRSGGKGHVPGGGGLQKAQRDCAGAGERNVVVSEAPLFLVGAGDGEAGSDLGGFGPSGVKGGIVGAVAVDVVEAFPGVPDTVAVGIDEGLESHAISILLFGRGVVIRGFGVGDRVPDFLNGRIGADNHFVTGAADGVSVVGREGEDALWGFRIVVESLGEGVVDRRLVGTTAEEGAGTKDVETFGKTRLHSEGPVLIRLAKGRGSCVVVVRKVLHRSGVEISHAECGEHFLFVGNCRFASRPPRGCSVGILIFKETDLVVEGGARGWLWNVS